jgi:hypothetical protein
MMARHYSEIARDSLLYSDFDFGAEIYDYAIRSFKYNP